MRPIQLEAGVELATLKQQSRETVESGPVTRRICATTERLVESF